MPDTTEPAGRRANGLPAADWGALVDLDPRLSEGLLDALATAGVPAYVEPATAVDTVHRAVTMPQRPLDRLWVDPSRADAARQVVAGEVADLTALLAEAEPGATAHGLVQPVPRSAARRVLSPPALPGPPTLPGPSTLPGPPVPPPAGATAPPGLPAAAPPVPPGAGGPVPSSDDDVFAQLVAQFHRVEPDGGAPRWPAAEDLPTTPPEPYRRRTDPPPPPPAPPAPAQAGIRDKAPELPGWVEPDALEDDGHYVPPPPPPVPRIRLRTLLAVLAVLLGLVLMFVPAVVRLSATTGTGLLGLVLLSGGAATLVWWMRDTDGGPGDGAVV